MAETSETPHMGESSETIKEQAVEQPKPKPKKRVPLIKKVKATKKGSKTITFNLKTNSEGDVILRTTRKLSGYTVSVYFDGEKLDSARAK
jgi:hypothetical protein